VPVTGAGNSIDAVLSAAPTVENRIPAGADWDGTTTPAPWPECQATAARAPADDRTGARTARTWHLEPVAQLSEWLQIMLAEIERKQEEGQRALEEQQRRQVAPVPAAAAATAAAIASHRSASLPFSARRAPLCYIRVWLRGQGVAELVFSRGQRTTVAPAGIDRTSPQPQLPLYRPGASRGRSTSRLRSAAP